jgi:UDP-glucose 4-epimerase
MKKILVTGGAGFIGSHIVDRLIEENHKVVVIDNLSTGSRSNLNKKAEFLKMDICDKKLADVFKKEKFDYVFHLAAQIDVRKSVENPQKSATDNILGSLNILENCKEYKIKKIIFTSTGGAIYGDASIIPTPEGYPENPLSPYGIEKLSVDKYLNYYYKVFKLPYISLRLGNVYGPRQNSKGEAGAIAIFADKMIKGESPIINGPGKNTRDFVYVGDVVDANILAMKSKKTGVYNIGTGKETNINTIFRNLKKLLNPDCKEIHGQAKQGEQKRSCLNNKKAKKDLNWKPKVKIEEGLQKTINWFKKQAFCK